MSSKLNTYRNFGVYKVEINNIYQCLLVQTYVIKRDLRLKKTQFP